MSQSMGGIISAERVETHVVETSHVHSENAAELFGFCIKRPVNFVAEMSLDGFSVRRQHAAKHPEFVDGAMQLRNPGINVLKRNQGHAFEPRTPVQKPLVKPGVLRLTSEHGPLLCHDPSHG